MVYGRFCLRTISGFVADYANRISANLASLLQEASAFFGGYNGKPQRRGVSAFSSEARNQVRYRAPSSAAARDFLAGGGPLARRLAVAKMGQRQLRGCMHSRTTINP